MQSLMDWSGVVIAAVSALAGTGIANILNARTTASKTQMDTAMQLIEELQEQRQEAVKALTQLEQRYTAQCQQYQEMLTAYEAQVSEYQATIRAYEARCSEYEATIQRLELEIAQLRAQMIACGMQMDATGTPLPPVAKPRGGAL